MKRIKYPTIGDYVLVAKYSDRSEHDSWSVGTISKVERVDGDNGPVLYSVWDGNRSYFECCWLITPKEGDEIIKWMSPRAAEINNRPKKAYR